MQKARCTFYMCKKAFRKRGSSATVYRTLDVTGELKSTPQAILEFILDIPPPDMYIN